MKINSITFGQTYINGLSLLSDSNRQKLGSVITIGQQYPVDLYLRGKGSRTLEVQVTRANLLEYLIINGKISEDDENLHIYNLLLAWAKINQRSGRREFPRERMIIKNMDNMSKSDVVRKVINFVYDYNEKYSKLFDN